MLKARGGGSSRGSKGTRMQGRGGGGGLRAGGPGLGLVAAPPTRLDPTHLQVDVALKPQTLKPTRPTFRWTWPSSFTLTTCAWYPARTHARTQFRVYVTLTMKAGGFPPVTCAWYPARTLSRHMHARRRCRSGARPAEATTAAPAQGMALAAGARCTARTAVRVGVAGDYTPR